MEKDLIGQIEKEIEELEFREGTKERVLPLLTRLGEIHLPTLEHSFRVANIGRRIAEHTHLVHPKALYLSGLTHDVGKTKVRPELLAKTDFTDEDRAEMRPHTTYGCQLLKGVANFSAGTLFYYHFFQPRNSYPPEEEFQKILGDVEPFKSANPGTLTLVRYCGRLMSLADFWDALKRNNNRNSQKEIAPTLDDAREIILAENPDQTYLINSLFRAGIFT
jgi:response regulator RpfG family c-di-GMP phosphodiesterase